MVTRIATLVAAGFLLASGVAAAQDRHKWWTDEKVRREIGLTDDQAAKAEEIFHTSLPKLRELKTELDGLEQELSALIRENKAEESVIATKIDAVERARGEMSKTRMLMLYRIHRLLTNEQHEKFKAIVDRQRARRRSGEHDR